MTENASNSKIDAIVLAAGRGSRFEGGAKLLVDVGGIPLIRRVLLEVAASPLRDIVLVIAEDGARVAAAAGPGRWRSIVNERAHEGIASSIRTGLAALSNDSQGTLVVLGDMPGMTQTLITRVVDEGLRHPSSIVHPTNSDHLQGHPVLWPSAFYCELEALSGDKGAKALIEKHRARVATIEAGEDDAFTDIDTRASLAHYRNRYT